MDNHDPKGSILIGRQIAAARGLIGMRQGDLARVARISVPTLKRMEASEGEAPGYRNNVEAVRAALESAGVEFIEQNGGGPGVRLKHPVTVQPNPIED